MPLLSMLGGMDENLRPDTLPDNVQVLVQNLNINEKNQVRRAQPGKIGFSANLKAAINSTGTVKFVCPWLPGNTITGQYTTDCDKTCFIVFYLDTTNKVKIVFRASAGSPDPTYTATVLTPTAPVSFDLDNIIYDSDAEQFVFVDGKGSNRAHRITISSSGTPEINPVGMSPIYTQCEITEILFDSYDNVGTGIGKGNGFGYRYAFRNKFNEASPVSPLTMFDMFDFQTKGLWVDDTYAPDSTNHQSIKSITISMDIPADAKYLDVYRTDWEFSESDIPLIGERLVGSVDVTGVTGTYYYNDSHPYSAEAVDLTRDDAPTADYVSLSNSSLFFANAVNKLNLPITIDKLTAIKITNNNSQNIINRYIQISMYDSSFTTLSATAKLDYSLSGFDTHDTGYGKFVFMADDLKTPLQAYFYPYQADLFVNGVTLKSCVFFIVRVPLLTANTTTTIYLIKATADVSSYYDHPAPLSNNDTVMNSIYNKYPMNHPRSHETLVSMSERTLAGFPDIPSNIEYPANYQQRNKANLNFDPKTLMTAFGSTDDLPLLNLKYPTYSHVNTRFYVPLNVVPPFLTGTYFKSTALRMKKKGFFYFWLQYKQATIDDQQEIVNIQESYNNEYPAIAMGIVSRSTDTDTTFKLYVKRNGTIDPTAGETAEITIANAEIEVNANGKECVFVFCSWENIINVSTPTNSEMKLELSIVYMHNHSPYEMMVENDNVSAYGHYIIDSESKLGVTLSSGDGGAYDIAVQQFYVQQDQFVKGTTHALQAAQFFPLHLTSPMGVDYTTFDIGGAYYFYNKNILFESLTAPTYDQTPGRIVWTNLQDISSINEHNIRHNIIGILPTKSIQPTDEHNTLLIWAADRKLKRMSWIDNVPVVIDELSNVLLINKYMICLIPDGVAWLTENSLCILQNGKFNEVKAISTPFFTTTIQVLGLNYYPLLNSIVISVSETTVGSPAITTRVAYIYSLMANSMFKIYSSGTSGGTVIAATKLSKYILHRGYYLWFTAAEPYYHDSSNPMQAAVTTKSMVIKKGTRIMVVAPQGVTSSTTVTLTVLIYDVAGTLYTTASYTVPVNKYFSIPSMRGNLVALQVTAAACDIEAIEVQ